MRSRTTRQNSSPQRNNSHPDGFTPTIRVLIADGDDLARNALRTALENGSLSVVGQAADAEQAVSLTTRCRPDVIILDGSLPPVGGIAAMEELHGATPTARAIILGPTDDGYAGLHALMHGAAGYLPRGIALESLARAVEGVARGEAAISRALAGRLRDRVRELTEGLSGMRPVRSPLTTREWEVLDLLRSGASTGQIAAELVLSPDTVHSHVQHIMRKLDARSRAEAVELAEQAHLPPHPST